MKLQLLLATNGFQGTQPAMQYGIWLASMMQTSVTLLGIAEPSDPQHPVKPFVDEVARQLKAAHVSFQVELQAGHTEEIINQLAGQGYGLVVLGPLGRPPLRRWLMGRSFRHIMAEVAVPILYVPAARIPLQKILVCLGGLGYEITAENLGIRIARLAQAGLTLLHVVPPIDLEYPPAKQIHDHWQHLLDTDTVPARTLRAALEAARSAGLSAEVKVRNGSVVHEILDEIETGDYDLVCMGSPYSTHSLRHLYTPNVTAEVAEAVNCPILTARYSLEATNRG